MRELMISVIIKKPFITIFQSLHIWNLILSLRTTFDSLTFNLFIQLLPDYICKALPLMLQERTRKPPDLRKPEIHLFLCTKLNILPPSTGPALNQTRRRTRKTRKLVFIGILENPIQRSMLK